jgi:hypothetical protein
MEELNAKLNLSCRQKNKIEASRETTQRAIVDILGSNHKL